jgi:ketosteroid isomerase-like protein
MTSMASWRRSTVRGFVAGVFALTAASWPASGQGGIEQRAVIAVAESALAAISRGDMTALTDLMLPEAVMFPTSTKDGVARYRLRTRAEQRAATVTSKVTERGFHPEAHVNGPLAMVWYPYDLYLDDKWSHCGVDVFTLIRSDGQWRISTMSWSAEQPPACEKHPDGPPKQ